MTNYKAHKTKNQVPNLNPIKDLLFNVCGRSFATLSVLDYVLQLANIYDIVDPSQMTISIKAGVNKTTANRIIKKLVQLGLLKKIWRPWRTCIYIINPNFNDLSLRRDLRHMFKSFRWIPAKLLMGIAICNGVGIKKENSIPVQYANILKEDLSSSLNIYINSPGTGSIVTVGTLERKGKTGKEEREPTKRIPGGEYEGNQLVTNRKEVVMSELQSEYMQHIPKILRGIDNLNFAGKVKLSAFPEDVLRNALLRMTRKSQLTNPFQYLFKVCTSICQEANKEPDWGILEKLPITGETPSFTLPFKGIPGEALRKQPNKSSWTTGHNNHQPNYKGGEPLKVKEYVPRPEWEAPKRKVETREEIDANVSKNRQSAGYPMLVRSLGQELVNKMEDNLYINSGHVPPIRDGMVESEVVNQVDNRLYFNGKHDRLTPDSVPPTIVTKKEEPMSEVDTTGEKIYREVLDFMELHNIPLDKAGDDYDEVRDTGEAYSIGESAPF